MSSTLSCREAATRLNYTIHGSNQLATPFGVARFFSLPPPRNSGSACHSMLLLTVAVVCSARAPRVVAIAHIVDGIALFLAPVDSPSALPAAISRRMTLMTSVLLDKLVRDSSVHFLDKRVRARRAMAAAAFVGDVALMEELYDLFRCLIDQNMVWKAIRGGHVEVLEWLRVRLAPREGEERRGREPEYSMRELKDTFTIELVALAAERGDLGMVQILAHEYYSRLSSSHKLQFADLLPLRAAARNGHRNVVEWLRSTLGVCDRESMDNEVHMGPCSIEVEEARQPCAHCLEHVVCYITRRMRASECTQWRMDHAAASGRLDDVQWFHSNRSIHGCTTAAMDLAATNGHFGVVRFLHENRKEGCTVKALDGAAANGHLQIARYLRANRTEGCSPRAMEDAAGRGDMAMVKWLLQDDGATSVGASGNVVTSASLDRAATNGHLDVVQFLHANSSEACSGAALVGAAAYNHAHVVRWLLEHYGSKWRASASSVGVNTPAPSVVDRAANEAAANRHLSMVKLLYAYTRDTGHSSSVATEPCGSSLLRSVVRAAATNGYFRTIMWAVQTYRDDCTRDRSIDLLRPELASVLNSAVIGGHLSVVRWIRELLGNTGLAKIKSSTLNKALVSAAQRADFDTLEWVRARHVMASNWAKLASSAAAFRGDLEVIQWFCVEYNGEELAEPEDTSWGRRACISQASRSQNNFVYKWLTWSLESVGPV